MVQVKWLCMCLDLWKLIYYFIKRINNFGCLDSDKIGTVLLCGIFFYYFSI